MESSAFRRIPPISDSLEVLVAEAVARIHTNFEAIAV